MACQRLPRTGQYRKVMSNNKNSPGQCQRAPRLLICSREVMFLGTCLSRQEVYRTTQEMMLICLQGRLTIRPERGSQLEARTCLVPAGTLLDQTRIDTRRAVMGLCF